MYTRQFACILIGVYMQGSGCLLVYSVEAMTRLDSSSARNNNILAFSFFPFVSFVFNGLKAVYSVRSVY